MEWTPTLTPVLEGLLQEARDLLPERDIIFQRMTDESPYYRESAGGAVTTDRVGNATVELDPSRADEYTIAHELMHIILHRSGWPQMYSMARDDAQAEFVASNLDNQIDHVIFHQRLIKLGVDVAHYRENFVSNIEGYPKDDFNTDMTVKLGFMVAEALNWEPAYRRRVEDALRQTQPRILNFGKKLAGHIAHAGHNKKAARNACIGAVKFFNLWYGHNTNVDLMLSSRIGVSPLFSLHQLTSPASISVNITTENPSLWGRQMCNIYLSLKSDGSRIQTLTCKDTGEQSELHAQLQSRALTQPLDSFLSEWFVPYGTL